MNVPGNIGCSIKQVLRQSKAIKVAEKSTIRNNWFSEIYVFIRNYFLKSVSNNFAFFLRNIPFNRLFFQLYIGNI